MNTLALLSCLLLADAAVPPPLPSRAMAPPAQPYPGETLAMTDGEVKYTLYLPPTFDPRAAAPPTVAMHFHTVAWLTIGEHLRRGSHQPLINFAFNGLSAAYEQPFLDTARFGRIMAQVEAKLHERGLPAETHLGEVDLSSFSAGFGAVRELLRTPETVARIRRIVLCDSLYADYEPLPPDAPADTPRTACRRTMAPWVPFAQAAARGEKSFVLTLSHVPTKNYASTALCAEYLLAALNGTWVPVARGELPAAATPDYPLQRRFDAGRCHLWDYAGDTGEAHMSHVRHLADTWMALDAAEIER